MNRDIASGLVLFGIAAAYYYGAAILPTGCSTPRHRSHGTEFPGGM